VKTSLRTDLWWAGNWNHGDMIVVKYKYQAKSSAHLISVLGWEYCCHGAFGWRYSIKSWGAGEAMCQKVVATVRDFSKDHRDF